MYTSTCSLSLAYYVQQYLFTLTGLLCISYVGLQFSLFRFWYGPFPSCSRAAIVLRVKLQMTSTWRESIEWVGRLMGRLSKKLKLRSAETLIFYEWPLNNFDWRSLVRGPDSGGCRKVLPVALAPQYHPPPLLPEFSAHVPVTSFQLSELLSHAGDTRITLR